MPRTKGEPNPIFAKLDAAADHLTKAKEALEKKPGDATLKKAVEKAQADFNAVNGEVKRFRFLNTTVKRANNVGDTMTFLKRSFDRKTYTYSDDEANKILNGLDKLWKETRAAIETAMAGKGETKSAGKLFDFNE